jgi:hypothetical protein
MGTRNIFYAAVGASDLAIERARQLDLMKVRQNLPQRFAKIQGAVETAGVRALTDGTNFYKGLVKRGEKTVRGIRNATPVKRAVAQTKTARSQTKAAVTSSRKAASTTVDAVKEAASSL